ETECDNDNDDDCDGLKDCADPDCIGATRACSGACGPGLETCGADGMFSACVGGDGSPEICGDGIDQDCSGADLRRPDAYEPNDTCATCTPLTGEDPAQTISASFDSVDDGVDCFKFEAVDDVFYPEEIIVQLEHIPAGQDYDLYLYAS